MIFENISRAFLNVAKSVIVPLVNLAIHAWFSNIGCLMLQPYETTKYFGCLIGFKVIPSIEIKSYLGKSKNDLTIGSTERVLSFIGRVVLLQHVLRAIPIYHLLFMSLNSQSYEELECISRDFL